MRTWLITGVSSGFGRAVAQAALEQGDQVVGTLRSEGERAAFDSLVPGRSHGVLLDVGNDADVERVVANVEQEVGAIDVLLNNAGYGFESTIEEATMDDVRAQFAVNVFGAVAVIKAVLPGMRQRRSGHILNVTSMGGLVTFPGIGVYHGSKFALEGISESLAKEVAQFGIKVTAVAPGAFRTEWAGRSLKRNTTHIGDYDPVLAPVRLARRERDGKQAGDPQKAAAAILAAVAAEAPPVHLLLGPDAVSFVRTRLAGLGAEIDQWETLSSGTNFD
ncbi:oxidoreductase [Janthinobacterium agaricidamnosum]|uniref:Putative dehydrogenase n=1 Tax=Janthinobacterium agaricidamnosum NBRC 102515 = DSM 9628 TaxID=1349767 RepID=W0VEH0_9BURK|nr:oxidoreductase [Janthinobacterium agaricidamnosum]CDG85732.1 putative dehydrogenase [Janthinobacterium agaricidamnosum NBRC 102515 = DSM 9628]